MSQDLERYYARGLDWYGSQFRDAATEQVVGEVCQDYLFHPEAATRIRESLGPDVRFMVSLRDPVERAWSSYLYMRKHGIGPSTFAEALRTRPELVEHGRYATGLDRFLGHYPKEQIHVALFDDLARDPQRFLNGVTDFVGVGRMALLGRDLEPKLPAARARSVRLAHVARSGADWVREHDGARLVGRVKQSPLVQRVLYRPIDRRTHRPGSDDVVAVRTALSQEIEALDATWGLSLREAWGWKGAVRDLPTG